MSSDSHQLLQDAKDGCIKARQQLLEMHRDRLRRMVKMRLHPLVKRRIDESDVVQEALWEASKRFDDFFTTSPMPFFLWLRFITNQKLIQQHRHHLDVQKRSIRKHADGMPSDASVSINLAECLAGREESPSNAIVKRELVARIRHTLDLLPETDRDILSMRHFEQMTNAEVAESLGLSRTNSSTRYLRALQKLQGLLDSQTE